MVKGVRSNDGPHRTKGVECGPGNIIERGRRMDDETTALQSNQGRSTRQGQTEHYNDPAFECPQTVRNGDRRRGERRVRRGRHQDGELTE